MSIYEAVLNEAKRIGRQEPPSAPVTPEKIELVNALLEMLEHQQAAKGGAPCHSASELSFGRKPAVPRFKCRRKKI